MNAGLSWCRRAKFSSSRAARKGKADRNGRDHGWQNVQREGVVGRWVISIISNTLAFPAGTGTVALAEQHGDELATAVDRVLSGSMTPVSRPVRFAAAYSNDVMSYIPSARVLHEGGYEAVDSMPMDSRAPMPPTWRNGFSPRSIT